MEIEIRIVTNVSTIIKKRGLNLNVITVSLDVDAKNAEVVVCASMTK